MEDGLAKHAIFTLFAASFCSKDQFAVTVSYVFNLVTSKPLASNPFCNVFFALADAG